ncbi:S9 family peptidase [Prosthecomicrobium sp. N25]|uniref:S9 family peptidase n=1 Tax=Prosthecomicrobium sp. N25 TaxID=3129254 RepID=UPI003077A9F1
MILRIATALLALEILARGPAGAEEAQPPAVGALPVEAQRPPAPDVPFSGRDLVEGVKADEAACRADPRAVWVEVDRVPACVRYFLSEAGGDRSDPVVFLRGALALSVPGGGWTAPAFYAAETPAALERVAASWSRVYGGPYIILARPGTYGSSGREPADRNSKREFRILGAALDAIRARHGFSALHLAGWNSGGNLAMALALTRPDVRCVAAGSAPLAFKRQIGLGAKTLDPLDARRLLDPLDLLAALVPARDRRAFVVGDPADTVVAPSVLDAFVTEAQRAGLPVRRLDVTATDSLKVAVAPHAIRAAIDCARGQGDDEIARTVAAIRLRPSAPDAARKPDPDARPATPDTAKLAPPGPAGPAGGGPVPTPAGEAFSAKALLEGLRADEADCRKHAFAVWVRPGGRPECLRYYYSEAGGFRPEALVLMQGDQVHAGPDGKAAAPENYEKVTADVLQAMVDRNARLFGAPVLYLARPGAQGSSGRELEVRHTRRELDLVGAALDAIKDRHGLRTLHVVGQSGGGGIAASLLPLRGDLGCVVSASGDASRRLLYRLRNGGREPPPEWLRRNYDPADAVPRIDPARPVRPIFLVDRADTQVPAATTDDFVARLAKRGIRHRLIETTAWDDKRHGLFVQGVRAGLACALGEPDETVAEVVRATPRPEPAAPARADTPAKAAAAARAAAGSRVARPPAP